MTTLAILLAKHWRAAALSILLAMTGALCLVAHHEHLEVSLARAQAAAAQAQVAVIKADAARNQAAIEQQAADVAARVAADNLLKETIHAVPETSDCARSPALRALLDGLRQPGAGHASAGAHEPADVRR